MAVVPQTIEQLLLFLKKHRSILTFIGRVERFIGAPNTFWLTAKRDLGITTDGKFYHILPRNGYLGNKSLYKEQRKFDLSRNLAPWFDRDRNFMHWTYGAIYDHIKYILLFFQDPRTISIPMVHHCSDIALKRQLIHHVGWERFLAYQPTILDQWRGAILYEIPLNCNVVQVQDATSGKFYYLLVPPNIRDCHEALAWTFGLPTEQYDPLIQT